MRRAPGHKRRGARAEPVGGAVRIQQQGAALDQEELVGARVDMQRRAGFPGHVDLVHRRHWPSARYATWLTDQLDHAANKVTEPM